MADTSLCLNVDNDDSPSSPFESDALDIEEEAYDALNDETFGAFEDTTCLDDWEQQHEQFAELAESSRQVDHLGNSIKDLQLENKSSDSKHSLLDYYSNFKENDVKMWLTSSISSIDDIFSNKPLSSPTNEFNNKDSRSSINSPLLTPLGRSNSSQLPSKFCTVEELERGLLQDKTKIHSNASPHLSPSVSAVPNIQHQPPSQFPHGHYAQPQYPALPRLPPGLPHPQLRHLQYPPGLIPVLSLPPHLHHGPGTPPPGLMYPHQLPVNHPYNFPPPPRMGMPPNIQQQMRLNHINQQQHQQHRMKMEANNSRHRNDYYDMPRDEYAGLMSMKEKQWLINIQLQQLNTGTPYFDDYYFTIYKERKSRNSKENQPPMDRRHRRNSDRPENQTPLTLKTYTPLQFENSLGKLQCGSVTAPRKIIDMDIVTPDKEGETNLNSTITKETKKTKQLLLELEAFYNLILKAEDFKNPLYKTNMKKLYELKQKQRFRELELATTHEQKQEIVQCLKQDSEPLNENPNECISKVVSGLFQEDKYVSFLNIRKGKTLLLRLLPHLTVDLFSTQLLDIWIKIFASLPIIGRKDMAGDNLIVRLHPHFKRFVQVLDMNAILELVSSLLEVVNRDSSRSTPISCQSRSVLNFVLNNKFGISALATIFVRTECIISTDQLNEKQQSDWLNFIVRCTECISTPIFSIATPLEPVLLSIFNKHCSRLESLTVEQMQLLEKCIVDSN